MELSTNQSQPTDPTAPLFDARQLTSTIIESAGAIKGDIDEQKRVLFSYLATKKNPTSLSADGSMKVSSAELNGEIRVLVAAMAAKMLHELAPLSELDAQVRKLGEEVNERNIVIDNLRKGVSECTSEMAATQADLIPQLRLLHATIEASKSIDLHAILSAFREAQSGPITAVKRDASSLIHSPRVRALAETPSSL